MIVEIFFLDLSFDIPRGSMLFKKEVNKIVKRKDAREKQKQLFLVVFNAIEYSVNCIR